MMKSIDYIVDRVTMYRLVLYVLIGLIVMAAILAYFKLLSFSPFSLLAINSVPGLHLLGNE